MRRVWVPALLLCAAVAGGPHSTVRLSPGNAGAAEAAPAAAPADAPHWRGPIASALSSDGRTLWTANRKSGTVTEIDVARRAVVAEHAAGKGLSSIHPAADGRLVVCDEAASEVLVLSRDGDRLVVRSRVKVGEAPAGSVLTADGRRCFVACLWGRRVDVVDLSAGRVERSCALDFRPRCIAATPDGKHLIAADGFGGRLAIIETAGARVCAALDIPGHNIRGMVVSPAGDRLLFTQLILNELETNTHQSVFWGSLMANVVRDIHLPSAIQGRPDPLHRSRTYFMGEVHSGSGDPYAVACLKSGRFAVTLSGSDQFAVFDPSGASVSPIRADTGRRPTGFVVSADEASAYTADDLADAVSVIDLRTMKTAATISLGPTPAVTPQVQGERLFFDARLSLDGWMSCQSCHTDGHTPGLSADTFGDSARGSAKRIKSLHGVGELSIFSWTGKFRRLEDQIRGSILTTQQGREPSAGDLAALAAYVRAIPRREPPAPADPVQRAAVERGRAVFEKQDCARCHAGTAMAGTAPADVGLSDQAGNSKFVPPSLRGVGENGPYFHDGRAGNLREVFTRFGHQLRGSPSAGEIDDLTAYLKSL